jgi:hypothetical protein
MLETKHIKKLNNPQQMSEHLHPFIRKWMHTRNRPEYITHMLYCLSNLDVREQKSFYFIGDQLHYVDQSQKIVKIDK